MRKKLFIGISAVAVGAIAAVNVNYASQNNDLSDLALANVEALAGEGASCSSGCRDIGWGTSQILRCDCSYTGIWSSCNNWGC
jgi:hypothetical protein